jgi:hypothetical protein
MSTPAASLTPAEQKMVDRGFHETDLSSEIYRGRKYHKKEFTRESTVSERILGGAGTAVAVGTVVGAIGLAVSETARNATITPLFQGKVTKTIYVEQTDQGEPTVQHPDPADPSQQLRYNPEDSRSIQAYLNNPKVREKLRESNGHYFLPEKHRQGISSFIFVPKGDFSKACSVKFWDAADGVSITDNERGLRAIRSYCAAHDNIESEWDKELTKLTESYVQKHPTVSLEDAKALINRRRNTLVLDGDKMARVYGKYDPNKVDTDSFRTGTIISLNEGTKKEIGRIHGKGMEHKESLAGEQPFKNSIPPPTPPFPFPSNFPGFNPPSSHTPSSSGAPTVTPPDDDE